MTEFVELIRVGRERDPNVVFASASFPPTEFLLPHNSEATVWQRTHETDFSDAASSRETQKIVRSAAIELSPAQRRAIELAFVSGLTQKEIAEQLQEPIRTIKARIPPAWPGCGKSSSENCKDEIGFGLRKEEFQTRTNCLSFRFPKIRYPKF